VMTEAVGSAPQARKVFPYIPDSSWWKLRRKFQQAPPKGVVDSGFLSSLLDITEPAAANLIGPLRAVGLIDEANRATDRTLAWRDDEQYRQATLDMIASVYPQGLMDVAPPPEPDRETVKKWFARTTGNGEAAVRRMTQFYVLLAAGDPAGAEQQERPAPRATAKAQEARIAVPGRQAAAPPRAATSAKAAKATPAAVKETHQGGSNHQLPDVHIDVQVHIDPAATAEQIDQIFASMARHLYGKE
jgi:hypothetical protein